MMYVLVIRIQVIENNIRIATMGGSEDYDLEVFAQVFKDLASVWSDVNTCLIRLRYMTTPSSSLRQ